MPETPDFDQIARACVDDDAHELPFERAIAEQLRLVWNARGAADLVVVNEELQARLGTIGYSVSTFDIGLEDALGKLDR